MQRLSVPVRLLIIYLTGATVVIDNQRVVCVSQEFDLLPMSQLTMRDETRTRNSAQGRAIRFRQKSDTGSTSMQEVMGWLKVDFPLADFLTVPDKALLSGTTSGQEVGTVTVDGVRYRHLVYRD
jgi:hypothetical protein